MNYKLQRGLTFIFFLFMSLLGIFCIIFEPGFGSRLTGLAELYFDLLLLTALIMAVGRFSPVSASVIRIILYIFFYVVALIDVACYVRLQSSITPIWIEVTFLTNSQEAKEAVSSFLTPDLLLSKVGVVLLLIALNITTFVLWKRPDIRKRFVIPSLSSLYRRIFIGCVIVIWAVSGAVLFKEKAYFFYKTVLRYDELKVQEKMDFSPKAKNYIPVYRLAYSWSEYKRMKDTRNGLEKAMDKVIVDSCEFTSPNIVLIIGESCNRSHSSLYGYDKPTTPYQERMAENGELIRFNDVISSWNVTCESFEYMFSLYGVGDKGSWYEYPLFTQLLKRSGYDMLFLSNQYVQNKANSMSRYKEDIFINSPRLSETQFDRRNTERHELDEGLIADYDALFNPLSENTFTIFHFHGLHFDFSERYPSDREYFKPEDYDRPDLNEEQKSILSAYDNAMRYNDSVIYSIIDRFRDKESIVIFVPDHGECIFDNCTSWGRTLSWNSNDIRQQFEIPFWIWASTSYRENHTDIWESIQRAVDKRFMTDIISQLILHLAGLSTPYYNAADDLLSAEYNDRRQRIIRGEKDFDEICR